MIRPSVNQITSAYTGRMPALQEQVEKDKQANNGIPSDLRKLMALQDLLSDGKHMGIDQALKAPQNPATVSQSLQDRARQILQARMAQAQQSNAIARKQQEAMVNQGRPGPVPQGIAQPERQPEGIDQLESNVGDSYAGGGIVAFSGEDSSFVQSMKAIKNKLVDTFTESPEDRKAREEREKLMQKDTPFGFFTKGASEYERDKAVAQFAAANPRLARSASFQADPAAFVKAYTAATSGEKQTARPATMSPEELRNESIRLSGAVETREAPPVVEVSQPAAPVASAALEAKKPAAPASPGKPKITATTAQPSIANLPAVADLLPPALPTPEKGSPRDVMGKSMTLDPDAEMNRILAAREKLVGAPDTSQYQALIEELRGQKAKLQKKPEPGFESLMEYFGEIAAGPTVGRSGKAGAMASERLRQRELDKEKQANALSERMIEAAQKQQDAIYGYKKEGFALSEGERARVFKERFDAAKAAGESDDRARTLGQQAVLEREKMKQQAELERERNAVTITAAGLGAGSRQGQLMDIAQALMKADTTGKLTLPDALTQAAKIVGTSALAGTDVRNDQAFDAAKKALDDSMTGILKRGKGPTAQAAQREYDIELAKIEKRYNQNAGAGLNSLPPTAIPPGVTVTQTSAK